jgi:hypothetical protein
MSSAEDMCRTKRVDLMKQYQALCFADMEFLKSEVKHWKDGESIIRQLPVEDQANYADFVTERMCSEEPAILAAYLKEVIEDYTRMDLPLKCCPIGNLALAIVTLTERTDMQGDTGVIVQSLKNILAESCVQVR